MYVRSALFALLCLGRAAGQFPDAGRMHFDTRCAGCHGGDGAGGEHAPGLVGRGRPPRTREELKHIIEQGIPEAGMPAFNLNNSDLNALIDYIGVLRAPAGEHPSEGDVQAGQSFFSGKGNCSHCHMVRGHGGVLGPDLSNVAGERTLREIEQALRKPESLRTEGYRPAKVQLNDGKTIAGIVKNESNYDLQLQDTEGVLRVFRKSQIRTVLREPKTFMPAVKGTDGEMRDLLAFITRLKRDAKVVLPDAGGAARAGVSFTEIANPAPANWPTYNGQIGGNRHSQLKGITAGNVAALAPAWMFPIANSRRLEVTPEVVDGIMYVTTANECYALDARNGRQIWHYARPLTKGVIGDAGSAINRGVAVLGNKVFMVTDHAHLIALDRTTGSLVWETEMADYREHYGATSAPLVVNDLVLSGTSGGDEGARGFVDAYRAETGERVWRFHTMPGRGEPGSETWEGHAIEHGCVTAWLTGMYDPSAGLVYWPTGNPCPDYNGDERKGDNLYSDSVVALDPKSGKLRWHYQFTPHDLHDWDATEPMLVVDAPFAGRVRKLLLQANRNGFFYVLDRNTGELLLARPFVKKLTWAKGIGADGRPQVNADSEPTPQGRRTCPSVVGATNWFSSAYDPGTGLFYVMALESCNIYTKSSAWWEPGKSFYGGATREVPGERSERFLRAIDIQTGRIVWEIPQVTARPDGGGGWGGVLSTAGGLVFFCDDSGAFAAADARSGKLLWHFHTNQAWHASPMTYAADGKQYVAVAAGSNIIAFGLR